MENVTLCLLLRIYFMYVIVSGKECMHVNLDYLHVLYKAAASSLTWKHEKKFKSFLYLVVWISKFFQNTKEQHCSDSNLSCSEENKGQK